jgi:hypothetical protein
MDRKEINDVFHLKKKTCLVEIWEGPIQYDVGFQMECVKYICLLLKLKFVKPQENQCKHLIILHNLVF